MERGSTEAPNGTTVDEFVSKVRLAGASSPTSVFKPTLDSLGRIGALLKSWVSTDEPLVTKHYKERELDVLQEAMYLVHSYDLVKQRVNLYDPSFWTSSIRMARHSVAFSFVRSVVTTTAEIIFALVANPMAPIISPVVFIYSVFVYAVIFTGLFVSVIGLSIVSITPIRFKAFIASLITDEYTKLSPVNWNSGGMFRARHKVIVDNAQLILGSPAHRVGADPVATTNDDATEQDHTQQAKIIFGQVVNTREKFFCIDVARTLLLFSAAVYERADHYVAEAAKVYLKGKDDEANNQKRISLLRLSEDTINDFAHKWGVKFTSASDCGSPGSAFSGIFYSSPGTCAEPWIAEWLIDATCAQDNAEDYLWGSCHQGFYNELFPPNGSIPSVHPYRRIIEVVEATAKMLIDQWKARETPVDHVNLWVTGHSLGAALASLFYARTLSCTPPGIKLRDAYVFGCPNAGGAEFIAGFEKLMMDPANNDEDFVNDKTFWRVRDDFDVVGIIPPGLANTRSNRNVLKPSSLLNYGSIGISVHLKPEIGAPFCAVSQLDQPVPSVHISHGTTIATFGAEPQYYGVDRDGANRRTLSLSRAWHLIKNFGQPLMLDHAPPKYWERLTLVADSGPFTDQAS